MAWLLGKLASFIGAVLAKLIKPLGEEFRKNRKIKQTGADDETLKTVDDSVWDAATDDGMQPTVRPEDRAAP